jgi:lysyl-tRNA synthetase class I
VIFDYSHYGQIISPIKELVGRSGFMQVSELTIDSFEAEDVILVTAIMNNGDQIEEDIAKKLFSLSAEVIESGIEVEKDALNEKELERVKSLTAGIAERNNEFFDDEVDKLDRWAEDVKKSLEIELKRMDIDLKAMKTSSKKVLNLVEKVKLHRDIKDLEKKRNEMRQQLYKAQDEVDVRKEVLLARIEGQLNQKVSINPLFTIKFDII